MARILILAVSITALLGSFVHGQDKKDAADKKPPIAPAEKLAEGWEEIDERLIFLMVRLANTETSLEAVEKAIGAGSRKRTAKTSEAKRAIGENEKMDRKGGGPMKWNQFYGTTAEKFFYHPTDRNSSYHTVTVLSPQPPQNDNQTGAGVPSRQGLPVHQRPPQFDYIYRANEGAAAKAESEAAGLRGKVEALTARRRELELEQVALWVEIAFRAAAHFELNRKPVFRFEPVLPADDPDAKLHADIMKTSAEFMRVALAIVDDAPKDQDGTLTRIKPAVSQAREKLDDAWLRLAVDTSDRNTVEGRFFALSKRLNDVSRNLTESYEISIDGDINADEVRKDTFRGQLQDSLISYAQIVLALDEMATQMKDQWNVKPDLDKPYTTVSLSSITPVPMRRVQDASNGLPAEESVVLLIGNSLSDWQGVPENNGIANWSINDDILRLDSRGPSIRSKQVFQDFDLHLEFKLPPKCNSGVFLRGRYEVQLLDSLFRRPNGDREPADGQSGAIYGQYAPTKDVYKGSNRWNTLDVQLIGDQVTVRMNDITIIESKTLSRATPGAPDLNESGPGPIVFQAHATPGQEFRNISVKRIDSK